MVVVVPSDNKPRKSVDQLRGRDRKTEPFTTEPFTTEPFTTEPFTTEPFTTTEPFINSAVKTRARTPASN